VRVWLDTPFDGGRHQRRLDKMAALEKQLTGTRERGNTGTRKVRKGS
jgi:hypothetical protein